MSKLAVILKYFRGIFSSLSFEIWSYYGNMSERKVLNVCIWFWFIHEIHLVYLFRNIIHLISIHQNYLEISARKIDNSPFAQWCHVIWGMWNKNATKNSNIIFLHILFWTDVKRVVNIFIKVKNSMLEKKMQWVIVIWVFKSIAFILNVQNV